MSEPDPRAGDQSVEAAKARTRRNIAIALALGGFVILVFLVTVLRMGGNVANRPL